MSNILSNIVGVVRSAISPGSSQAKPTSNNAPPVGPVPTPNPAYGGGSGAPTGNQFNTTTQQFTSAPSWDAGLSGRPTTTTPAQVTQINASRASNGATPVAPAPAVQQPQNNPSSQDVNPNDAGSIKAAYEKYAGWNDNAAIIADYKAGNAGARKSSGATASFATDFKSPDFKSNLKASLSPTVSKYTTESDMDSLLDKYAKEGRSDAAALAADLEARATANADREYSTVMEALSNKKKEAMTLAEQQSQNSREDVTLAKQNLTDDERKALDTNEKSKQAFLDEDQKKTEDLARSWRDLSLEVQRISRAKGASDSSFSAGKETDLLIDFNRGLRTLADGAQGALKDFALAVDETTMFYGKQKAAIELAGQRDQQQIDNWVRSTVTDIQSQEGMALNKKLEQIDNAILQGNQLKINTEQKIRDQQLSYGLWLQQAQQQLKLAVINAAKTGSAQSAADKINEYRKNATNLVDLVTNKGYALRTVTDPTTKATSFQVYGRLPGGQEDVIALDQQGYLNVANTYGSNLAGKQASNNPINSLDGNTSDLFNNIVQTIPGYSSTQQAPATPTTQSGGLMDSLKNLFK